MTPVNQLFWLRRTGKLKIFTNLPVSVDPIFGLRVKVTVTFRLKFKAIFQSQPPFLPF
jgi:hypothetical protein